MNDWMEEPIVTSVWEWIGYEIRQQFDTYLSKFWGGDHILSRSNAGTIKTATRRRNDTPGLMAVMGQHRPFSAWKFRFISSLVHLNISLRCAVGERLRMRLVAVVDLKWINRS